MTGRESLPEALEMRGGRRQVRGLVENIGDDGNILDSGNQNARSSSTCVAAELIV